MSRMAELDVLIQQAVIASVQAAKWLLDVQYRTVAPDQVASELTHLARELDGLVAQIRRIAGKHLEPLGFVEDRTPEQLTQDGEQVTG